MVYDCIVHYDQAPEEGRPEYNVRVHDYHSICLVLHGLRCVLILFDAVAIYFVIHGYFICAEYSGYE